MIGQKNLCERINSIETLPKCVLLIGDKGSEQIDICKYIANKFNLIDIVIDNLSVANIRDIINLSYQVNLPTLYVFNNADNMSVAAQNALLKTLEEPPNKAYFILILEDKNNTLNTIQSRGTIFNCDNYSYEQLNNYFKKKVSSKYDIDISQYCNTPGDIDILCSYNINEFYNYADYVFKNIVELTGAECFTVANKIKLKATDENKYDLNLFLNMFLQLCLNHKNNRQYLQWAIITQETIRKIKQNSVNLSMVFDMWILDIRKVCLT